MNTGQEALTKKRLRFWKVFVSLYFCLGILGMSQQPPQPAPATIQDEPGRSNLS
jgi:hypothetical protein